jgi:acetylornithine deacetylase
MTKESVRILSDLVGFDTTSRNSNLNLIGYVESYLADHGVASERIYDEMGTKANLWATIGPPDVPGVVLSGHTDVVPVDGQDWTDDPFKLVARDGALYGRGACDMKGYLAVCLAMVSVFRAARLERPIHLAFSYDEEVGCLGVRRLIDRLNAGTVKPAACVVGEPTGMQVVTGHKAKRSLRVTVRGRACHSSLAPQGVNAIDYAARLVLKIREIGDRLAGEGMRDEIYDVPFTTAHTGTIHGGTALNIVPDTCVFDFEFRALPAEDVDGLVTEVEAYARDTLEPEMRARAPETGIAFDKRSAFPGLDTAGDADFPRAAQAWAARAGCAKVAYGTEAGLFVERGSIPAIVCGPGSIAQAHRPDEFVALDQLAACEAFMLRLADDCAKRPA